MNDLLLLSAAQEKALPPTGGTRVCKVCHAQVSYENGPSQYIAVSHNSAAHMVTMPFTGVLQNSGAEVLRKSTFQNMFYACTST